MADDQLTLRFHHDVVEHLGLRLYQNKPAKVICELISNSWDADATQVRVQTEPQGTDKPDRVSVFDNGAGMTRAKLQSAFLTIASPRRGRGNAVTRSDGGRLLMGRKGLGKLAPFGICKRVNVISVREGTANWIELDLDAIGSVSAESTDPSMSLYHPNEVLTDASVEILKSTEHDGLRGSEFTNFLNATGSSSGTAIILTKLVERATVPVQDLLLAIGRRFTVTLARDDFKVVLNDEPLRDVDIYPKFAIRIPEEGMATDLAGENPVRFWVGFAEKPIAPNNEAGIGVYAHGKLAQERPFFFSLKGNDIVLPYIYGVVEADWVDETSEDLISTDRSNLDWTHPATQYLLAWGQKRLREWINRYQNFRIENEGQANRAYFASGQADPRIQEMNPSEQESLIKILSEITPALPPTTETRTSVTSAITDAWLHKPARDMLNKLWREFKEKEQAGESIAAVIASIRQYIVPEALSSTVTISQRAFALSIMDDLINKGTEPDLQKLIESFPWLIGPDGEYLTANQRLRTVVEEAEKDGRLPRQSDRDTTAIKDDLKPDFVFLSNAKHDEIIVVEMKSPQVQLTIENREQLGNYMSYLEVYYRGATIKGMLIGNGSKDFYIPRSDMTMMAWSTLFYRAKSAYAEIIASMISGYAESSRDLRIREVHSYGGAELWKIIAGLAEHDEQLRRLIRDFKPTSVTP